MNLIETIGDEDQGLPFSMYGFGGILKGARIQYYLGVAEDRCGNEKAARRLWSKAGKSADGSHPGELAWGQLAAAKVEASDSKPRLERALEPRCSTSDGPPAERAYAGVAPGRPGAEQKEAEESLKRGDQARRVRHYSQLSLPDGTAGKVSSGQGTKTTAGHFRS